MGLIDDYWLFIGTICLLFLLTLITTIYIYMTRKFGYWKKRNVLEIKPIPLFGNFADGFFMKKCPGEFIKNLYDESSGSPYMGFYIFDKPFFLIRDPDLIKHVLVKDFDYFADKYSKTDIKDRLGWANLFMIKNPAWKFLRSKLTPFFTSGKLKKMFDLMVHIGNDLDTHLESLSLKGKGKTIDVKDICAKFTTDLIGITAYGLRANSLNDPNADFRRCGKKIFDFTWCRGFEILTMFLMPSLIKLVRPNFFGKENCDFLRRVFWENIEHRINTGTKKNDLIDLLIELKTNYKGQEFHGFKFDGDDLVAQAAVFFTGGFETSSTTLAFSLYELALHPEIQTRLRKEIHEALASNDDQRVTYDMVVSLPYLDMVISETLRKYPVFPFIERITGNDYKVPGHDLTLEKGTPVYISSMGLHYDPRYFPEPHVYNPERFNKENKQNIIPYTYLPFGEGPHMCIGLRLGLLESKYGLVQILRKYRVSPCEKTLIPIRLDPKGLTITALGGLYLNISELENDLNRYIFKRVRFSGKFSVQITYEFEEMAILTAYWGLDGIVLFFSLWILAYLYMTRKFKYWQKRGIMEIPPLPFIGNFWDCFTMKKSSAEFVQELYKRSEGLPYIGFYIFDKPFILIRDPELVKNVLVKDFNYFFDRYASPDVNDRLGYANLFMMKNPGWKILRAKLTPIFTSGKLKKMFELMIEIGNDLDKYLDSLGLEDKGKNMEMKEICAKFTTDLIGTTAFGLRTNSLSNPNAEFRKYGQKIFEYNFSRGFEFLSIFFIPGIVKSIGAKFFGKEVSNFLRDTFWNVINERIASGNKRNDLIDLLIELKKTYGDEDLGGFKFDGDDLVAQTAIFFSGGFETSSTVMAFTVYELALQPDLQTKLREEILEAIDKNNGKFTYDMVTTLPYLDMVVSETLRMYPPLGFLDRIANQDYKVPNSDLIIEKGTPIMISMIGMHYDPQYFPNPEKFDPERFNEVNKRNRQGYVYFPFGEGPHVCIGTRIGLLQAKLGLIHLLKEYEYSPCESTIIPMRYDPKGLTTTPLGGIQLNVRKYVQNVA
ncbi:uncharacterized protein LOC118450049 [Vespa mandarinia]|uniref:uncharacterized protein LOC118450049 n=1 Tax=Vespa mandarinia TaxID=7446 RepID=UPI001607C671|nr:uncharacterized protein LOC118450049 [Vespa mandarinia]